MELTSSLILPSVMLTVGGVLMLKPSAFDSFLRGARDGLSTAVSILPTMVLLMTALSMFNRSGAAEALSTVSAPLLTPLGIPPEVLPLALTRPVSGSASSATFASLLETFGADSLPALTAAVLMGSSDTLVYVIATYFGQTRVKTTGRAFPICIASAILCLFVSSCLVQIFFD